MTHQLRGKILMFHYPSSGPRTVRRAGSFPAIAWPPSVSEEQSP